MADGKPDKVIVPEGGWINPVFLRVYQENPLTGLVILLRGSRAEPDQGTVDALKNRFKPSSVVSKEAPEMTYPVFTKDASGQPVPLVINYFVFNEGFGIMNAQKYGVQERRARVQFVITDQAIAETFSRGGEPDKPPREEDRPRGMYVGTDVSETVFNSLCENKVWALIAAVEEDTYQASQQVK